jgi:D-alanyl-D-alanine carboxypeptidase (penicillin-binding protein 5/6)
MSRELMSHSRILQYTTIWMDSLRDGEFELANTNKLLRSYSGITGLKTGYTDSAGYCLSATAERDGMGLVAVVLGADSSADRFSLASTLLDYGFANYAVVTPEVALPPVTVHLGQSETVQPVLSEEGTMVVPRSQADSLTVTTELAERVEAPVNQGDVVGELVLSLDGQEQKRISLTAGETVERLQFGDVFRSLWREMCCG